MSQTLDLIQTSSRIGGFASNMPWAVYRCDPIRRGEAPQNESAVSFHLTPSEAMDEANSLKRRDRAHSYTVGPV